MQKEGGLRRVLGEIRQNLFAVFLQLKIKRSRHDREKTEKLLSAEVSWRSAGKRGRCKNREAGEKTSKIPSCAACGKDTPGCPYPSSCFGSLLHLHPLSMACRMALSIRCCRTRYRFDPRENNNSYVRIVHGRSPSQNCFDMS